MKNRKNIQVIESNFGFAMVVWCYLQARHEGVYSFNILDVALSVFYKFNWASINGERAVSNSSRIMIIDRCKRFKLPTGKELNDLHKLGRDKEFEEEAVAAFQPFNDALQPKKGEGPQKELIINCDEVIRFVGRRSLRGKSYLLAAGTPKDERMYKDNDVEIFYQKIKIQYPDWMTVLEEMGLPEKEHDAFFVNPDVQDAYKRAEKRVASRLEATQLKSAEEGNPAALNAAVKRMERLKAEDDPATLSVGDGFTDKSIKPTIHEPKEEEITV